MRRGDENRNKEISLYAEPGLIGFYMKMVETGIHRHHAVQITIGLSDRHLVETATDRTSFRAMVIDADVPHLVRSERCLILLIEPESRLGRTVRQERLRGGEIAPLDELVSLHNIPDVVERLGPGGGRRSIDDRIAAALRRIDGIERTGRWGRLRMSDAAQEAHLSASRFRHLFVEHIGISWRRYVLWRRLIEGLRLSIDGTTLTEAAVWAGFSDGAHMSRVCRSMFGVTPSEIARNSRFVQAE